MRITPGRGPRDSEPRPCLGFRPMPAIVMALVLLASSVLHAQTVPLEYRVKAAYLFNFAKFIEWPVEPGPLTICVAGRNVFGDVLSDTVKGETINGRPLVVRVLLEPEPGCHITFVPRGAAAPAYLRAARSFPELTVGESADFI